MACQPVEMLLSPPSSLAATRTSVVISGTPAASFTMPAVGIALDVVDVRLVEGPGVDLALRPVVGVVDRAIVEAEGLGGSVHLAAREPGVLGRLEGLLGRVGDERLDGGLQLGGRLDGRVVGRDDLVGVGGGGGQRGLVGEPRGLVALGGGRLLGSFVGVVVVGAGRDADERAGEDDGHQPSGESVRHVGSPVREGTVCQEG